MFDFLKNPAVELVLFSAFALFFWFISLTEMPESVDEETGNKRTCYQRWKLSSGSVRRDFIVGCLWAVAAFIALLDVLGIVEVVGP